MRRTATLTAIIAGVSPRRNLRSRLTGRRTARRHGVTVAAAAVFAVLLAAPGSALALEQKLTAADGAANDRLGISVDVDGDTAVVGAYGDDTGRGAVYVYGRSGDQWTQTAKLTASDGVAGDNLGRSVAIDGDTIVAGAPGTGLGSAVYTFARTGPATRNETAILTASDATPNDLLGASVAIDGDTIVAGASGDDTYQGSAYTFARVGPITRNQTAKLRASDGAAYDQLGSSVAIDGDTIVVGAPGNAVARGSVYTYARYGPAVQEQTAKLTATNGAEDDSLGTSVAIDGDTIVAGAYGSDVLNLDQGAVYTFASTGAAVRNQTAQLYASSGGAGDLLGRSVAIEGDTILAGAPFADVGALSQGAAYTFARTGAAFRTDTATLADSDGQPGDQFGEDVAISGDARIVGSWVDDVGANAAQGSATIFFAPAGVVGAPPPAGSPPAGSPPAGPGLTGTPPFPAKLAVLRARVATAARRLDVLAPISTRASGRVSVSFQAAGRTTRFTAPVDATRGRVRINRLISARQARLGTGILTISYPGDADTQPQVVRLRAASRPATLRAQRPKITNGRLTASGRISARASGVVRVQLLYEPAGQDTVVLHYNAKITRGRYAINRALPANLLTQISERRGVVHSYTLFTGDQRAGMRGEMASYQVLPSP